MWALSKLGMCKRLLAMTGDSSGSRFLLGAFKECARGVETLFTVI